MSAGSSALLLAYLETSVVIVLAWGVFASFVQLSTFRFERVGPAEQVRVGRVLIVVALLAPIVATIVLALVPELTARPELANRAPQVDTLDPASQHRAVAPTLQSMRLLIGRQEPGDLERAGIVLCATLLLGMIAAGIRSWLQFHRLRRILQTSVTLRRVGRVRVLVSDQVDVPFSTLATGAAQIVLPVAVLADSRLLRVVLRHECQHHRQGDTVWAIGLELLRVLFFWHPAIHVWFRHLHDLQELACDEAVIRQGVRADHYGECLLRVADMALQQRMFASVAMATASDRGRQLRRRLERLFETVHVSTPSRWRFVVRGACVALVLVVTAVTSLAWPRVADVRGRTPVASRMAPLLAALGDRQPVPPFEFRSEAGQSIDLASLRGSVVLVGFWDADCRFCPKDAQALNALREQFSGEPFAVVGVSISQSVEAYESCLDDHEIAWPQRHEPERYGGDVSRAFGVRAVPSHYAIDREGSFVHVPLDQPLDRVIAALLEE